LSLSENLKVAHSSSANAAAFEAKYDDVFSRIAGHYDVLCDLFSVFIHRAWKQKMAQRVLALPWRDMLDTAAGTGDISLRVMRQLSFSDSRNITVSDICPPMLAIAERRAGERAPALAFRIVNAEASPEIESCSVDLYTISFGIKICDRARVLSEAYRVLRPGGTFICMEASEIPFRPLHRVYLAYMNFCLPAIGYVATGGDRSAYGYLLRGIHGFPNAPAFASEIASHGFADVGFRRFTLGIVAMHEARKPTQRT
jgi:demethylmenaquinone methyltransferase / 2-methoxy-6-polyprenyl-1,4-benzoquinol methylase